MGTKRYTTINGRIIGQNKNGVCTRLLSDPLGNVIATMDASGVKTNDTTYWPYGEVRTGGVSTVTSLGFCGAWGYYTDASARFYVRARYYRPVLGRWQSKDPLWPRESAYGYSCNCPTTSIDPSGLTCTSLTPTPENCAFYKDLCRQGYVFACNSYYACLNTGDNQQANCTRCCLQMRLQGRIKRGQTPTCDAWIDDHDRCFKHCDYNNPCTNPTTLRLLCNNLFDPGATVPLVSWPYEWKCADLLRYYCSWPTPYPDGGIRPPKFPWKCLQPDGSVADCEPVIIPWSCTWAINLPPNPIPTWEAILKNCLEYTQIR